MRGTSWEKMFGYGKQIAIIEDKKKNGKNSC
jgi:hypothetical protein